MSTEQVDSTVISSRQGIINYNNMYLDFLASRLLWWVVEKMMHRADE